MAIQQFIESVCVQDAVYWAPTGTDGYGSAMFADPVAVKVRWDIEREVIQTKEGEEIVSNAKILIPRDVQEEGYIALGTLADLDSTEFGDPKAYDGAYKILQFTKVSMPKSLTDFVRTINV